MNRFFRILAASAGAILFISTIPLNAQTNTNGVAELTKPMSPGQPITTSDVLWAQYTSQGIGTVSMHNSARIIPTAGQSLSGLPAACSSTGGLITCTWDVTTCSMPTSGGVGTGLTVPVNGWLESFISDLNTTGFGQSQLYINHYVLNSMPAGGGTGTCVGTLTAANIGMPLSGAATGSFFPVGYPSSGITSPWLIPGSLIPIIVTNPAAGADWVFTTSGNARTCIQSVSFQLVTSATVANRLPVLRLFWGTGGAGILIYPSTTAQAASATQTYSFSPGLSTETVTGGTTIYHAVPFNNGSLICSNGGAQITLSTLTTAIQPADQYSLIAIMAQVQQDNN